MFATSTRLDFDTIPRPAFGRAAQHLPPHATLLKAKAEAKYRRAAKTAAELLPELPENGECVHALMLGTFDEQLVERLDKDSGKVFARHIAQRQALYARRVNNADLRTALAVLDSEAKLRGLFPDQIAKTKDAEATTKSAPLIIIAGPEVITPAARRTGGVWWLICNARTQWSSRTCFASCPLMGQWG